jgi:aminoglycoside phosphotransferase (APT) family kinase protein
MWPFRKHIDGDEVDERVRSYLERELPGRLGVAPSAVAGAAAMPFDEGHIGWVRYVDVEGIGRVVLRVFHRSVHRRRPSGLARLSALLAEQGLRVPRVLVADDSRATRRAYGIGVVAEEFLEGQLVSELPAAARAEVLDAAADLLARLHTVRSPVGGKPWEGTCWPPLKRAAALARNQLRQVARLAACGLGASRARALARWFVEQFRPLARPPYPLVHNDFHAKNLVWTPQGELGLIDLATMAYWFPHVDLVQGEESLCAEGPELAARFLGRYFAASGGALSRESYGAMRPAFAAWGDLARTASRARRALKQQAQGEATWEELRDAAVDFWGRAEGELRAAGAP